MKTEKEIKAQLKLAKKNLSRTEKLFEKYDNWQHKLDIKIGEFHKIVTKSLKIKKKLQ